MKKLLKKLFNLVKRVFFIKHLHKKELLKDIKEEVENYKQENSIKQ